MNVVLVHPIHGAKIAINEKEMEQDIKNGWAEYAASVPEEEKQKPDNEVAKRKYVRKGQESPHEGESAITSGDGKTQGE